MDGSSMGNLLEGMQAFKKMRKRFYDAVIRMEQKLGKEPEELSEFAGSKNVLNLGHDPRSILCIHALLPSISTRRRLLLSIHFPRCFSDTCIL